MKWQVWFQNMCQEVEMSPLFPPRTLEDEAVADMHRVLSRFDNEPEIRVTGNRCQGWRVQGALLCGAQVVLEYSVRPIPED